jgi:predicted alpha/beta hydrolase
MNPDVTWAEVTEKIVVIFAFVFATIVLGGYALDTVYRIYRKWRHWRRHRRDR